MGDTQPSQVALAALAASTAPPFLSIEQKLARLNAQGSLIAEQQRRIAAMQQISLHHIQQQAAAGAAPISSSHMPGPGQVALSSPAWTPSAASLVAASEPAAPHPSVGMGLVGVGLTGGSHAAQMRAAAVNAAAARHAEQPGRSSATHEFGLHWKSS
jgi:hypothetical protein